jgi:RNA polymerase sigma-70 factor (ECF subfamily)
MSLTHDSFAELVARLREGEGSAADRVVQRFTRRLIALARSRLDAPTRHKVDPEDVVQSVYKSFFHRFRAGRFDLASWEDLWRLLTVITLRKCANQSKFFRRERRQAARESGEINRVVELPDREPSPREAAVLTETIEELLRSLPSRDRPVLELSLQGYTVLEISQLLGRAERTVWRLREHVRRRLQSLEAGMQGS